MSSQQQPHLGSQQMPMQNPRMMATSNGAFPPYSGGMPSRQVQMPMSQQQQRMTAQPRYIIAQPQQQNTQTPSNSQQLHTSPPNMLQNVRHDGGGIVVSMSSGSQLYQSNPQIMHQMNRNQQRPMQPGQPQIQMMQQQGTPPNQLNYNTSSPYTPPQNPSTPQQQQQYSSQHQMDQRHYNQQPSTPQDRQMHQRIQQQSVQRPLTPQQQHAQSPIQRKNTPVMVKTNSMQNMNDQPDQQHYVVQNTVPTSVYSVVQGPGNQSQMGQQINDSQQAGGYNSNRNMHIRHPVTQHPVNFTNQTNNPVMRYAYQRGQQNQPPPMVIQSMQQPRILRPNGEYRQQLVQIVRSESDLPGPTTYRIPNNEQTYVVTSQPNVFYRTTAPQQPNSAIRQALETSSGNWDTGHDSYQQQIQTSQAQVILQPIDNSGGPLMFKMPTNVQRQTSTDNYDSNSYIQTNVPTSAEANVSEYSNEQQSQRSNIDDDAESTNDDVSPAKKPKLTPKSAKNAAMSAGKQAKNSKPKKAPVKSIANKTIITGPASEFGNSEDTNGSSSTKPIFTKDILEQAAKSISQSLTLEEDAKAGVILYMENFVSKLINETSRAANLRKSSRIQNKDVEFALKFFRQY